MTGVLGVTMVGSEWSGPRIGGLERYFSSLAQSLSDRPDVELNAWAFGESPSWGRSLGKLGKPMPLRILSGARRMQNRAGHVFDRHFAPYGAVASRVSKGAVRVVHFHGPWAAESLAAGNGSARARAKRAIESFAYRSADRFVVLSEAFADLLSADYGVDRELISVVAPGVDLDRFGVAPQGNNPLTVLCVRRLERRMGIDVLLRAWPSVRDAHGDARLRIVGVGTAERELRGAAERLPGVEFLGRVNDRELAAEYAAATVTAVPSRALEGFGLIALESLASGRAPIVTDVGGLPEAVTGLDDSLVVPAGDAERLAERLSQALSGQVPSPAACRSYAEGFSWSKCADRHVTLYRELVSRSMVAV